MAGGSALSPKLSDRAPAPLCGWSPEALGQTDIPPMLAAQSAFPSGPWAGFRKKFSQLIGDDPKEEGKF